MFNTLTGFTYRGLTPHKFTPMPGVHNLLHMDLVRLVPPQASEPHVASAYHRRKYIRMRFDYTQVFLLTWTIAFWVYYFSTYGKVEEKHEGTTKEKYGVHAKWGPFFGLAFLGWTVVILIYFFHYDSIDWVWKLSFLDCTPVKLIAIIMMCFAFLLNILFTVSVGKSIQDAFALGEDPKLITSGVYGYIRHPGYLAFFAVAFGSFLIIPNLITMVLLIYTCVVVYGHTLEEEEKLLKVYGAAYERYQSEVGRFLPKLKRKSE